MTNKWLDPTKYSKDDEFIRAYNQMHARAMAYADIIKLVEEAEGRVQAIAKQIQLAEAVSKSHGIS